ncbi:hypothetical protein LV454_28740, partial [Escherichia coli]|nr:hypothetical protein [Escherichia coli]
QSKLSAIPDILLAALLCSRLTHLVQTFAVLLLTAHRTNALMYRRFFLKSSEKSSIFYFK